jgi:hypothetical protein
MALARRGTTARAAALVMLAVTGCSAGLGTRSAPAATSGGDAPQVPASASQASRTPSDGALARSLTDPFAGTPAANWRDGTAGIAVPAARTAGTFTAAQVRSAYETTRGLLTAAGLDKQTLLGGTPSAFASLLTRQQRTQFLADLDARGVTRRGDPRNTRGWVVAFAPGSTEFVGDVIKVHGTMSARPVRYHGSAMLDVDVDYIFVYAVEPPREPGRWIRIVAQYSGPVQFGDWAGASSPFQPWALFGVSIAGALCGTTDGYVHPDYPPQPDPRSAVSPTGPPVDPYTMRGTAPGAGCQASTGT